MSSPEQVAADSVSLDEARRLIDSGTAVLVDVREQHEWDAGHAAEAVHVPIGELDAAALPPGMQIITTCRSGGRGARAAAALARAGLPARSLANGMRGWQDAGLPLESADGTPGSVD
ncbi:MAG TPA: rhodanese-like domain-containing protein [Pseudonocardiaceae bacterium]|nr:rhodanese-like domain-containing protein [Pseudonocardiaceae bacterium]